MKDYLIVLIGAALAVFIGVFTANSISHAPVKFGDFGSPVFYTSPTMATTSVGTGLPVALLTGSGSVTTRTICNTSPTTTNDLILELDATSTALGLSAPGILVPGNSCYAFSGFTGNVYGLFTTTTSTVSSTYK